MNKEIPFMLAGKQIYTRMENYMQNKGDEFLLYDLLEEVPCIVKGNLERNKVFLN